MADSKDPSIKKNAGFTGRKPRPKGEELSSFVFGKVPPQAIPLEEAVLGALMIDKDALTSVLDILQPESFYLDAHQLIYRAMLRLFERSQPIDLLTVTEELKKTAHLEAIGGPYYLVELTNKVASSANIEFHGRLIAQKFIQRELIRVSNDIIRNAYEDTTDVFDLLDDAEQGLFSIAEKNMSRSYDTMSSLAAKALKQIEELKGKEDGLTGVPTGFTDLDRITSGWQPSDLVIMAARPGMGKTSLVLSLAKNAAVEYQKGVAIFSLEMASIQLAQRLISMESEVPLQKMRNGQLEEDEWKRLKEAIERISDAPVYIDDTPGINIFELRAKCRRMKLQYDIQLIIIDYLQLMSGGGEAGKGNREQEVSAISRALKGLAKELSVPVIALSQLSRAVETRGGSKRPQLSDLRESGCLTGDARLQDAHTGQFYTIKDLAERPEQEPVWVVSMDKNYQLKPFKLLRAFSSGQKQVFELVTRTGRKIKASANHPFLKFEGWAPLEALKVGDRIAVPAQIHIEKPTNILGDEELILLAHLIGDGCILPKQAYHYTSADTNNLEVVSNTAEQLFGIKGRYVQQGNWAHVYLPCPFRLTHGKKHPITAWYEKLGIERVRSYQKRIPQGLFECDEAKISLFLHHLWSTDGNISQKIAEGRKNSASIYYASSSPVLAWQVQHLLLRLGIRSSIYIIAQGKHRNMYQVAVQGVDNQLNFLENVGCFGERGSIIPQLIFDLKQVNDNPNYAVLPKESWDLLIYPAMKRQGFTYRKLFDELDLSYAGSIKKNGVSVERLKRINNVLKDSELEKHIQSDVLWDEILAINSLEVEEVYDATIEESHNFVANDIIVHNSIEQDADMVTFIYRPEYYQILEDEQGQSLKGIAEIIIAKNRHGAQDTVRLKFTGEFARFSNLDDPDFGSFPSDVFTNALPNTIITMPSRFNDEEDIPF
jgi:replicative DNA helicase